MRLPTDVGTVDLVVDGLPDGAVVGTDDGVAVGPAEEGLVGAEDGRPLGLEDEHIKLLIENEPKKVLESLQLPLAHVLVKQIAVMPVESGELKA